MTLHSIFQDAGVTIKYLSLACLLCIPITLNAQMLDREDRIDFNAHLQSVTSDWRYDNETRRTRIGRAGFGWSETLTPYFSGGLLFGYLDLSQSDNPLDAGKYNDGYYGGLLLEGQLIQNDFLSLKLNLSFLYNNTQRYANDQLVNNVWTQTEAKLLARISLGKRLGLRLDINNYWLRGEQRDSGAISNVSNFREDQSSGYAVGLDVVVDRHASVGFDWLAGNREGWKIYFRRLF